MSDNAKCDCCGRPAQKLEDHHVLPKSMGGVDEPSNVVSICHACHALMHGKASPWPGITQAQFNRQVMRRRQILDEAPTLVSIEKQQETLPMFLDVETFAKVAGLEVGTIRRLVSQEFLKSHVAGRQRVLHQSQLDHLPDALSQDDAARSAKQ